MFVLRFIFLWVYLTASGLFYDIQFTAFLVLIAGSACVFMDVKRASSTGDAN
jgi:hypothetical protein